MGYSPYRTLALPSPTTTLSSTTQFYLWTPILLSSSSMPSSLLSSAPQLHLQIPILMRPPQCYPATFFLPFPWASNLVFLGIFFQPFFLLTSYTHDMPTTVLPFYFKQYSKFSKQLLQLFISSYPPHSTLLKCSIFLLSFFFPTVYANPFSLVNFVCIYQIWKI